MVLSMESSEENNLVKKNDLNQSVLATSELGNEVKKPQNSGGSMVMKVEEYDDMVR